MTGHERKIRVLCVDDHEVIREGIFYLLRHQPDMELIAQAADGQQAVEAYRAHRPDIVLMDLRMPHMNGLEALRAIREFHPQARVILLTTYGGDANAAQALKAGAAGYLLKNTLRTELLEAIRTVAGGQRYLTAEIASSVAGWLSEEPLSAAELSVLRLLAKGLPPQLMAEQLQLSEGTVEGHLRSILSKLHARDRTQAISIALKRGILEG